MIDKLIELKNRAVKLSYKDERELDDIQRKTKMYLGKIFPLKFTYVTEVDSISFHPSYYVSGMGDSPNHEAWMKGRQELINLLDTRIEEARIELQRIEQLNNEQRFQPEIQVVEKIIKVEDNSRINELTNEIKALRSSKNLWQRINWATLIPIIVTLIGGSFLFGKYFGESKFDKEKIELFETNKLLHNKNDSLTIENANQAQQILNLIDQLPKEKITDSKFPLKISISYSNPISIFEGKIFIQAEDKQDHALLKFKGIKGLSELLNGKFDSVQIEIKQGDRFFFKDESLNMWTVNVLDTSIDVDLEVVQTK